MIETSESGLKAVVKLGCKVAALVGMIALAGVGGVAFAIWLLGKCAPWPAYGILCGVLTLSAWRVYRSFEILVAVAVGCFAGAMVVGSPKIPPFGHYGVGAFAGISAALMIMDELEKWLERRRTSHAHAAETEVEE